MPSGWDVYYVVLLSAGLALTIPAFLAFISFLVQAKAKKSDKRATETTKQGRRLNTRFFMGVNAALILIAFILVLVPCIGAADAGLLRGGLIRRLIAIVSVSLFSSVGLLYAVRKGDLDWLNTYRHEKADGEK